MLPALSRLIDLQELDKEILEFTQAAAQLPEELAVMAQVLAELQEGQAARQAELDDLKRQHRETEGEMRDLEESIRTSRQRLMEIKNNIEYRAMLKEIGFKEDQRDHKETRILEFLELMEKAAQVLREQTELVAEQEKLYTQRQAEAAAREAEITEQLARLDGQRQQIMPEVPPDLLKRYEFIRQRRNCSPIAEVQEGVCLGCHMNILPQQYIDLQKGEEIIQCHHCQRILYWLGEAEAEETGAGKLSRRASS